MLRRASKFLLLSVPLLSLIGAGLARADAIAVGLSVTVYNNNTYWNQYNNAPPVPPTTPIAGVTEVSKIDQSFDAEPLFGMYDDFVVKYEGFITAPCTCLVEFMAQGDDGTILYLDGELITNDWYDKGGGGSVSQPVQFQDAMSKQITLWYYENGGGAWVTLYWMVNNEWSVVPASAFTQSTPTTTTEAPTTTVETTTTTEATTTTTVAPTTTYQPATSTSTPTTTQAPATTIATSSSVVTTTTLPAPTTTDAIVTTTTSIPAPTQEAQVQELVQAVNDLIDKPAEEVTVDELEEVLSSEVAAELSDEQVAEVIDVIAEKIDDLSETELAVLSLTLSNAPESVKDAFEEEINVFDGKFDSYIPTGSSVSVGQRRVLNAVVATIIAAPALATSGTSTRTRSKS